MDTKIESNQPMNAHVTIQSPEDRARGFIEAMMLNEARSTGDTDNALHRIARDFGVSYWTLQHIRKGRTKSLSADLFHKIRNSYLDHCAWKIKNLQHQITMEAAQGDDLDADLVAEAEALLAKIQAKREANGG